MVSSNWVILFPLVVVLRDQVTLSVCGLPLSIPKGALAEAQRRNPSCGRRRLNTSCRTTGQDRFLCSRALKNS